jgi:diadenosine tetraphosphate (Ap4A) HIT family hydrolase
MLKIAFPERTPDLAYRAKLEQWQANQVCPFCEEIHAGVRVVLAQTADWLLTPNIRAQKDEEGGEAEHSLLVICKRHPEGPLTADDYQQIGLLTEAAQELFPAAQDGFLFAMRVGNRGGVTLAHPHGHLIVARLRPDDSGLPVFGKFLYGSLPPQQ